ncbi:DinB family protein [Intrasporangium sp. YIM S08009]|uniref:DinB family protein n=1 Tax=Intrasporangium zincisolvens TaxID=3080018 RepID=UPI002B05B8DD|nr:DinB family protein [Intrasporangium sp. YIM S08009]
MTDSTDPGATEPGQPSRTEPPLAADEATTLVAFLDYHRDTLRWKTAGLTAEQLATPHPPSTLTLGGLLKHVALNEASWFGRVLHGRPMGEPWDSADWDADPDWELTSAKGDSPEELHRLMDEAVETARGHIDEALAAGGLDRLSVVSSRKEGRQFSLRWILLHMIEEYARHNGHADLIRESLDGVTGE